MQSTTPQTHTLQSKHVAAGVVGGEDVTWSCEVVSEDREGSVVGLLCCLEQMMQI